MALDWKVEKPASTVAALLSSETQELPTMVMRIDAETAAIVIDLDGVDYVLTMVRVPQQQQRSRAN